MKIGSMPTVWATDIMNKGREQPVVQESCCAVKLDCTAGTHRWGSGWDICYSSTAGRTVSFGIKISNSPEMKLFEVLYL